MEGCSISITLVADFTGSATGSCYGDAPFTTFPLFQILASLRGGPRCRAIMALGVPLSVPQGARENDPHITYPLCIIPP